MYLPNTFSKEITIKKEGINQKELKLRPHTKAEPHWEETMVKEDPRRTAVLWTREQPVRADWEDWDGYTKEKKALSPDGCVCWESEGAVVRGLLKSRQANRQNTQEVINSRE